MDYEESLRYLDRLGNEVLSMKFGLETIRTVLGALGNPQDEFPSILIAGTNGKGSVACFLSNILSSGGLRTALYMSPHVVSIEERFQVSGHQIAPPDFAECLTEVARATESIGPEYRPTYFETLTAAAFLHFVRSRVEIAVLEVGMGGRLDSTNVVDPLLSVITPVGLDHQAQLGANIEQIAAEKAGIIHPLRPVLVSPQTPEAYRVIRARAEAVAAPLHELETGEIVVKAAGRGVYSLSYHGVSATLRLPGRHQTMNAALAIRAVELLSPGLGVNQSAMADGIRRAEIPGRIQKIGEDPLVFVDGGHNRQAADNLMQFLTAHTPEPRSLVFSMMRDKEIAEVAAILRPAFDRVFVSEMKSPRAAPMARLLEAFPEATVARDPIQAIEAAKTSSATIVVFGSFYLAGEVLRKASGE
ncbi:MAG: bifunctional folylpolyglutamate synthase/dihydrofolate synthase [Acidobacteria bacterium]|nr:MAG: bifunctional folylpolyglutamate synthase/dihydrofolate synthase [Acidobacteriota bacterium]